MAKVNRKIVLELLWFDICTAEMSVVSRCTHFAYSCFLRCSYYTASHQMLMWIYLYMQFLWFLSLQQLSNLCHHFLTPNLTYCSEWKCFLFQKSPYKFSNLPSMKGTLSYHHLLFTHNCAFFYSTWYGITWIVTHPGLSWQFNWILGATIFFFKYKATY